MEWVRAKDSQEGGWEKEREKSNRRETTTAALEPFRKRVTQWNLSGVQRRNLVQKAIHHEISEIGEMKRAIDYEKENCRLGRGEKRAGKNRMVIHTIVRRAQTTTAIKLATQQILHRIRDPNKWRKQMNKTVVAKWIKALLNVCMICSFSQ